MRRFAARILRDAYMADPDAKPDAVNGRRTKKVLSVGDPVVVIGHGSNGFIIVSRDWKPYIIDATYLEVVPDKELRTLMAEATLVSTPEGPAVRK